MTIQQVRHLIVSKRICSDRRSLIAVQAEEGHFRRLDASSGKISDPAHHLRRLRVRLPAALNRLTFAG